jgi:hypothetical protein
LAAGHEAPGQPLTLEQWERALTARGWVAYARQDYGAALDDFTEATQVDPRSYEAWLARGYALYGLKRYQDAQPDWERAAKLAPDWPAALFALGLTHWRLGLDAADRCAEYKLAAGYFQRGAAGENLWPQAAADQALAYRAAAHNQYLVGQYCPDYGRVKANQEAVSFYARAVALDPEPSYWYRKGWLSYAVAFDLRQSAASEAQTWLQGAIDDLEHAIQAAPRQPLYAYDQARMLYAAWSWAGGGPAGQAALLKARDRLHAALALDANDHDEYEPNSLLSTVALALAAAEGDLEEVARLSEAALARALAAGDMKAYRQTAASLRAYLLEHPEVDPAEVYWPLWDDRQARQEAVAALARPDLYWRYRAEYGFGLLADDKQKLILARDDSDRSFEQIMKSVAQDMEQAFALKPDEHRRMRDFYVDGNVGWLYLRRGDQRAAGGDLAGALTDYELATLRMKPHSKDAAGDLTEALFKAGQAALQLDQVPRALRLFERALDLMRTSGRDFGLAARVPEAAVQTLASEDPVLAGEISTLVEELSGNP